MPWLTHRCFSRSPLLFSFVVVPSRTISFVCSDRRQQPLKTTTICLCATLLARQPSHKTFRTKVTLGKKMKQNRPIPHWIRLRTDNTIR